MQYIERFLKLRCAPDVLATVHPVGNNPIKEISESFAIVQRLKKIVLLEENKNKYSILDLCSGNALTPVLAVHLLPVTEAVAVDKKRRNRNWRRANRFRYEEADIFDGKQMLQIIKGMQSPIILTGAHPCTTLALQAVKLYKVTSRIKHLVIMPCCNDPSIEAEYPEILKKKLGPYLLWAYHLSLKAGGNFIVDQRCLSPKNAIVFASKK